MGRGNFYVAFAGNLRVAQLPRGVSNLLGFNNVTPVSYTHLC